MTGFRWWASRRGVVIPAGGAGTLMTTIQNMHWRSRGGRRACGRGTMTGNSGWRAPRGVVSTGCRGFSLRGRDWAMRAAAITLAVALAALAMGTASARAADRTEAGAMIDVATSYFGDHCVAGITVAWVVPGGLDGADVPGGHAIGRGAGCRI